MGGTSPGTDLGTNGTFDYFEARALQIADDITRRIAHATPGASFPSYDDLNDIYGTSRRTLSRACAVLRERGLIRCVESWRGSGHEITGHRQTGGGATEGFWDRIKTARAGNGPLWPTPGEADTCPVCGGGRRGEPHPVWGWACSSCVRTGAVITHHP